MAALNYTICGIFGPSPSGNLTHGRALDLTQSALSVQIRKLEELGHALFDRRGRRLHLTEAGRIALDHADAIFATGRSCRHASRNRYGAPGAAVGRSPPCRATSRWSFCALSRTDVE